MSVIERALDALPPAHARLWRRARDVVREVVSVHYFANRPPSELLIILAEDGALPSAWVPTLGNSSTFWESGASGLLVLALRGPSRWEFLRGLGLEELKAGRGASRSFAVITVPRRCNPGISWSTVIDRGRLS